MIILNTLGINTLGINTMDEISKQFVHVCRNHFSTLGAIQKFIIDLSEYLDESDLTVDELLIDLVRHKEEILK